MTDIERFAHVNRLNDGAGDAIVGALHAREAADVVGAVQRYRWAGELLRDAAALTRRPSTQAVFLTRALELELEAIRLESVALLGQGDA